MTHSAVYDATTATSLAVNTRLYPCIILQPNCCFRGDSCLCTAISITAVWILARKARQENALKRRTPALQKRQLEPLISGGPEEVIRLCYYYCCCCRCSVVVFVTPGAPASNFLSSQLLMDVELKREQWYQNIAARRTLRVSRVVDVGGGIDHIAFARGTDTTKK